MTAQNLPGSSIGSAPWTSLKIVGGDVGSWWSASDGALNDADWRPRYKRLNSLHVILDSTRRPVAAPSLFLARIGLATRGVTDDSVRTYAECLISWSKFCADEKLYFLDAREEDLQNFRLTLYNNLSAPRQRSTAGVNLKLKVVVEFYKWAQMQGFRTSLGGFLQSEEFDKRRALGLRPTVRHPRGLGMEEVSRILGLAKQPYRLAFKWAITTGMRRAEICRLRVSDLPSQAEIALSDDGLVKLPVVRKGGRLTSVYAPVALLEETNWHIMTLRPAPQPNGEDYVFLNRRGSPVSRSSMSKHFRQCANAIGSSATLHWLRHTFAIQLLTILERSGSGNNIKIAQVLLGHATSATTEIYLEGMSVTSEAVIEALSFLYGAGPND
ncbi:tyrosine-type recombinase/integrase [Roseateles sp. MS654]|uniref:tyrosine-type recombinase/integrase n=1 Tax=Roseateles sp. MS654 TaxID=3412685 RepID=UPI003C3016A3